ncbi:MAG: hypothetical protein HY084_11960 [Gemmatimonadetes bacterium]|nr:hypothetical protein [Gemmatimonadota bacterium]
MAKATTMYEPEDLARLGHELVAVASRVLSDCGDITPLSPTWLARHITPAKRRRPPARAYGGHNAPQSESTPEVPA